MGNWIASLCQSTVTRDTVVVKQMQIPIIWILGGPGTGKTIMAHRLCERYKFTYISMGELLSQEVKNDTVIGKEVLHHLLDRKLVSRDILFHLIQHYMAAHASYTQGFILDGYPREIEQRIDLETKIAEACLILYFRCSDNTMKERLYASSDAPELSAPILQTRKYIYRVLTKITNFHRFSRQVIDQYPDKKRVACIDAEQDKLKVYIQCRRHMDILLTKLKRHIATAFEEDLDFFI